MTHSLTFFRQYKLCSCGFRFESVADAVRHHDEFVAERE